MDNKGLLAVIAVAVVAVFACSYIAGQGQETDDQPERIGIIGAMVPEIEKLKDAMTIEYTETIASMEFCVGVLEDQEVVVVQCGMGKVNAGLCAHTLINKFNVTRVINTGAAGSLDNRLDIGDFVISTDAVQHDFDVSPIGFVKGEIPYTGLYAFQADPELRELAKKALSEYEVGVHYLEGRVCTGDQFIATPEQKQTILDNFGGLCCEMEGGAIAQACYLNNIPFVIIRAVSDKADGSDMEDYSEFEKKAAERCAFMVLRMIDQM